MGKGEDGEGPSDVSEREWRASADLLERLLDPDGDLRIVVSTKTLMEWELKKVTARAYLRILHDLGKIEHVKALRINAGQRRDLTRHIEGEDVCFVLTAAGLNVDRPWRRYLISRDPRSCLGPSRAFVKRKYKVYIQPASEFLDLLADFESAN